MFDERAHLTKGSVLISSQGGREVRGSSLCYDKIYLIPHKALLYSLDFPPPPLPLISSYLAVDFQ